MFQYYFSLQIKKCFVEDIDLTKTYEDFEKEYAINDDSEDDDEDFLNEATEKYKEYLKKMKKNVLILENAHYFKVKCYLKVKNVLLK